jgi:2-keto-4-pentenoate hydratase
MRFFGDMTNRKLTRIHRSRDSIKCECGAEIVILPDLRAMGDAIEVHVALHLQKLKAPACTTAEAERLQDALIAQVFIIASELGNDEPHE